MRRRDCPFFSQAVEKRAGGRAQEAGAVDGCKLAVHGGLKRALLDGVGAAREDEPRQDGEAQAALDHAHDGVVVPRGEARLRGKTRALEEGAYLVVEITFSFVKTE